MSDVLALVVSPLLA
jgi:hypothetical protein